MRLNALVTSALVAVACTRHEDLPASGTSALSDATIGDTAVLPTSTVALFDPANPPRHCSALPSFVTAPEAEAYDITEECVVCMQNECCALLEFFDPTGPIGRCLEECDPYARVKAGCAQCYLPYADIADVLTMIQDLETCRRDCCGWRMTQLPCGNGVVDPGEQCDTSEVGVSVQGHTCASVTNGELGCGMLLCDNQCQISALCTTCDPP